MNRRIEGKKLKRVPLRIGLAVLKVRDRFLLES